MTQAVIITGAGGGIGVALCERLRLDGYFTIGMDISAAPAADAALQIDVSDSAQLIDVARELAGEYDVKAVVHNAAVQPIAGAGATTVEEWTNALSVNVVAIDALAAGTRESLAANDGSIVAIGSVHGRATTGGVAAYATTKAALEGWVRSAALDLGPEIRVNAVAPGAIDTAKLREGFARWGDESAEKRKAILRQRTALRRIGDASDVAGAVSFLIGNDARFVTGTVLVVDGGATARLGSE
ncbi:SDR family oxidoreductase [Mycolicibacterium sp. BiH015]|uniref:SDR family NAD(P)-dependent oxidoreductase n=1 Tax=Mycolicibacterium sp. BiH015 TaxID=3018808 RepID=UPI0022E758B3|nr:SDR family oxidoreductase [Mycolicibacterium sp. BiH015]MDA2895479.1 SDR family oxidoreductase [Mycolicibacterium sp. BiH015]